MDLRTIVRVLRLGARLRCPRCGRAPLFRGFFAMYERCPACGLVLEREQGYFVGAIYVNYAVTVGLTLVGFFLLERFAAPTLTTQILLWSAFGVLFPIAFFRYSRSLWLSVEYLVNPDPHELSEAR